MFEEFKSKLDIVKVAEKLLDQDFIADGSANAQPEDKTCPFCGHKDCFKLKIEEDGTGFFRCFSAACEEKGDVITLVQKIKGMDKMKDAVEWLSKEFGVEAPAFRREQNPLQEIFEFAADYYHNNLFSAGAQATLVGKTPLEYQTQVRKHAESSLKTMKVGWADGRLVELMLSVGYDRELIVRANLMNKSGRDFFPSGVFVYPHTVDGKVSHFTMKDPMKQMDFQLPYKATLNNYIWANTGSLKKEGPVALVEGENDLLALLDVGWASGILPTIGTISKAQLEELPNLLSGRDVVTFFDSDVAGDKYREKLQGLAKHFNSLKQVKVEGCKDIDEFLGAGGDLKALLMASRSQVNSSEAGSKDSIVEQDGCYFRLKYKDGEYVEEQISDFTIRLKNVFLLAGNKTVREVTFVRWDGLESAPITASSEAKISLKSFKVLVADAIDGSFIGTEFDLSAMWKHVYLKGGENRIFVPDHIGHIRQKGGWLFGNMFISDSGQVFNADETGVISFGDGTGIKAVSLRTEQEGMGAMATGVPRLVPREDEEVEKTLLEAMTSMSLNLHKEHGRIGEVLTMFGYMWACAYADPIFDHYGCFPMLYMSGQKGTGKTTYVDLLTKIYGMCKMATNTLSNYNSGVGWSRMMGYYSCLPMFLDEYRASRDEDSEAINGPLRGYYDRHPRTVASKDSWGVREYPVRATLLMGGEDIIQDPATLQRFVLVFLPNSTDKFRDTNGAYTTLRSIPDEEWSSIGYYWIKNKAKVPFDNIVQDVARMKEALGSVKDLSSRTHLVWALIGSFARKLAAQFFPHYDYMEYVSSITERATAREQESTPLIRFLSTIAEIQVQERSEVTHESIKVSGNELWLWFEQLYNVYARTKVTSESHFSKDAIRAELLGVDFFVKKTSKGNGSERRQMGSSNTTRRVVILDIDKSPDIVKEIAEYARSQGWT